MRPLHSMASGGPLALRKFVGSARGFLLSLRKPDEQEQTLSDHGTSGPRSSILLVCIVGLTLAWSAVLARQFPLNFNPDSIALLQLAEYWRGGQWNLAVSSYWGPLFPILLSPLLAIGIDPLLAGRLAMIVTGIIYLLGARSLLKALGLVAMPLELCTLLAGGIAAVYSAMPPTADL